MSIGRLAWIIAAAIFILIVNVGLSVLYMVFYSYVINPGQSEQFYQDHVQIAAPYCSIVFGIPLFYFVCRRLGGRWEKDFAVKAAILVWLVYALIDAGVLIAAGLSLTITVLMTISLLTKLISAYFGGLAAGKKPN
jgi:hypothetical protein